MAGGRGRRGGKGPAMRRPGVRCTGRHARPCRPGPACGGTTDGTAHGVADPAVDARPDAP
jgi:hypothetical protein